MAEIIRGRRDPAVKSVKEALDAYEAANPGAVATLYRQNGASIRIRIVDERFAKLKRTRRHDKIWDFLESHVPEDTMQEITVLLPLAPGELTSSMANMDYDDPIPSRL